MEISSNYVLMKTSRRTPCVWHRGVHASARRLVSAVINCDPRVLDSLFSCLSSAGLKHPHGCSMLCAHQFWSLPRGRIRLPNASPAVCHFKFFVLDVTSYTSRGCVITGLTFFNLDRSLDVFSFLIPATVGNSRFEIRSASRAKEKNSTFLCWTSL